MNPQYEKQARSLLGSDIDIALVPLDDSWACDAVSSGDKFCNSYVNSYIVNGGIIMPCYDVASDAQASEVFQELFSERRIVQVPINNIALGGGIHCITQQQVAV